MDQKQKSILLLGIALVLVVGSWLMFWPPRGADPKSADDDKITMGLDIQGGLSVIMTAVSSDTVTADEMERATLVIQNRVDGMGAKEASIQKQGSDSILVQIPGIKDSKGALEMLGNTGQLEFIELASIQDTEALAAISAGQDPKTGMFMMDDPENPGEKVQLRLKKGSYSSFMTGEVVKNTAVSTDNEGEIQVTFSMDSEGQKIWGDVTTRLSATKEQVVIAIGGIVYSAPQVNEPILTGDTSISGSFTVDEAKRLRAVLEAGSLPVDLTPSETRIVGPSLGQDSLQKGVMAALFGLGLVAIYVFVFYRGLGLLTVGALGVFASVYMGILAVLSRFDMFSLTLPGIAGIVLTIGIAADSSILILERFKEEVRMGRTIRSAANSGSMHGLMTSVDADLVTFVSAAVLFLVAIGPVKGFALTLMIGIACDVMMMLLFKRPVLILLGEKVIGKAPWFWGVPREMVNTGAKGAKGGVAGV